MKSKHFIFAAILVFIGVISFFQVSSYSADMNGLNAMYIVGGIIFCLSGLIWIGIKYSKQGPSKPR